jgi:antitoxin YefM
MAAGLLRSGTTRQTAGRRSGCTRLAGQGSAAAITLGSRVYNLCHCRLRGGSWPHVQMWSMTWGDHRRTTLGGVWAASIDLPPPCSGVQLVVRDERSVTQGRWTLEDHDVLRVSRALAETLNAVVDDREEVVITRAGHEPVVIVALFDYESLKETAYLLRSPQNARRLLASIDRLEHGGGVERDILE